MRKMGVSNYDISSTLATSVSQRLVRRICPNCSRQRPFTQQEIDIMSYIGRKSGVEFDFQNKYTFEAVGCEQCNNTGYLGRIGVFEILMIDDEIKELITNDASTLKIKELALNKGYKPLVIDAIYKVLSGITTLEEINKKLAIY